MATRCPSCGGPLLGDEAFPGLQSACPACLAALLVGEPGEPVLETGLATHGTLGGHRLLREIARGGMGTVWKAERVFDGAMVALKLLPQALGADPLRLARFRAEATLAARLVHPRIVTIRDIGEEGGVPFFTMDLVEGPDLGAVAAGMPMPPREAARVVMEVAWAVQFAHEQGVLHRDIKPTNVLIAPDGSPRVTDFGLARLLEPDARLTATGEVMGSPSFMAPESIAGQQAASGAKTDVHGLGGLLYFCLTGRAPFAAESVTAALAKAMESRPVPPREWDGSIPASLEAITMRCLARDPSARYASAGAVAEDLERALRGEPVRAMARALYDRPSQWARRWKGGVMAGLVAAAAAGTGRIAWATWTAKSRATAEALRAGREATALARYAMDVGRAGHAAKEGSGTAALDLLEGLLPPASGPDVRGIEWFVLRRRVATPDGTVRPGAGARPGEWIAWNGWPTGAPLRHLLFSANGSSLLATHGGEGETQTRSWRVNDPGAAPVVVPGLLVAVEPGARQVLTALPDGPLQVRRLDDGGLMGATRRAVVGGASSWGLSADGAFLAAIGPGQHMRLVHVGTGRGLPGPVGRVTGFRLSPDGNGILLAMPDGVGWFTLRPRREAAVLTGLAASITLDGTGKRAAIGRPDGEVVVVDPQTGLRVAGWKGHSGRVMALSFAPDGRTLMSGGEDGWLRFWNTTLWREVLGIQFAAAVEHVEPSPDGQRLAVATGGQLHLLDTTGASAGPSHHGSDASPVWVSPEAVLRAVGPVEPATPPPEAQRY